MFTIDLNKIISISLHVPTDRQCHIYVTNYLVFRYIKADEAVQGFQMSGLIKQRLTNNLTNQSITHLASWLVG